MTTDGIVPPCFSPAFGETETPTFQANLISAPYEQAVHSHPTMPTRSESGSLKSP